MAATATAVATPDIISRILFVCLNEDSPKNFASASRACKLWHEMARDQDLWKRQCIRRYSSAVKSIRTSDFCALYQRLWLAENHKPVPFIALQRRRLSDCMIMLRYPSGPVKPDLAFPPIVQHMIDVDGDDVMKGRLLTTPGPSVHWPRTSYAVDPDADGENASTLAVPTPGLHRFFKSLFVMGIPGFPKGKEERREMLAAHGYATPFAAFISNVSVTLVSKIDGRVASLTDGTPVMTSRGSDAGYTLVEPSDNTTFLLAEVDINARQRDHEDWLHRDQWRTRIDDVVPNHDTGVEKGMIEFFVDTDRLFIRLRPLTSSTVGPHGHVRPHGERLFRCISNQPPETLLQSMRWK